MTLFFTYDGSDLGNTTVRLEGGMQVTAAADGTIASAQVTIDDPTGALSLTVMQQFSITETACSAQRLFTGYIYNIRQDRGPFVNGAGRVWTLEIADLNWLLHLAVLRGSSAKRPLESGNARMTWLLSQLTTVADNGLVGANPWMFDEADYRGRYPNEVLPDLCVSSSTTVGRIFFVYWDQAAAEPALFIDVPSAAVNSSTLRLSNVLADVDDTVTFAPYRDSEIGIVGEDVFCGVYFTYKGTSIYRHDATTHAAFFSDGYHRDGVFSTDRVGNAATAIAHADQFLDAHSGEVDEITCLVKLPRDKVNLIDAGMRIQVKFSHLRGYTSFTWVRVQKRTVILTAGTNEFYDVQLTLSTKGRDPLPSGDPGGDFPKPACGSLTLLQSKVSTADNGTTVITTTYDSAPTEGNLLLAVLTVRGSLSGTIIVPSGWSAVGTTYNAGGSETGDSQVYVKDAGASEPAAVTFSNQGNYKRLTLLELATPGTVYASVVETAQPASSTPAIGPITPEATSTALIGVITAGSFVASPSFTVGAGWTEVDDGVVGSGAVAGPRHVVGFQTVASPSGTYSFDATQTASTTFAGIVIAVSCVGGSDPPAPGQVVPWTVVTMAGAVGTTAYPYADESLLVKVDGVLISPASYTETDPAAGTFTLSWTPDTDETVTVQYLGR